MVIKFKMSLFSYERQKTKNSKQYPCTELYFTSLSLQTSKQVFILVIGACQITAEFGQEFL